MGIVTLLYVVILLHNKIDYVLHQRFSGEFDNAYSYYFSNDLLS